MKALGWYHGKLREMQQDNYERNKLFRAIDKMVHNDWQLPEELDTIPDIRAVIDTTPSDALTSAAIALSTILPRFKLIPHGKSMSELKRSNDIEYALTNSFAGMNKRYRNYLYDKVTSSLRYNMIVSYIDDMYFKFNGVNDKRAKRAKRLGRFKGKVYPASRMYPIVDEDGVIDIGHIESFDAPSFIRKWRMEALADPARAPMINEALDDMELRLGGEMAQVQQMYYMDDEAVVVWARLTDSRQAEDVLNPEYTLMYESNDLDFFPWSIEYGGSSIETSEKYKLNPLLAVLYHADSWENSNLVHSLGVSETIRRAREPRDVSFTRDGDAVRVDREDGNTIAMRTGENFVKLSPSQADPMIDSYMAMIRDQMARTTGASILGDTATLKSDTPFATYSAMLQVALGRLDTNREMIARSCVQDAQIMAEWVEHSGIGIEALRAEAGQYGAYGEAAAMAPGTFDAEHLYEALSCDIKPKVPTDRQQDITAAIQLMTHFGYPQRQALEDVGIEQPELMMQEQRGELLDQTVLQNHLQELQAETQLMIERKMQEMQIELQSQMQQGAGGGETMPAPENQGPTDIANAAFGAGAVQGDGFNPAVGGISPLNAQPGMGNEQITGMDRMGNEL